MTGLDVNSTGKRYAFQILSCVCKVTALNQLNNNPDGIVRVKSGITILTHMQIIAVFNNHIVNVACFKSIDQLFIRQIDINYCGQSVIPVGFHLTVVAIKRT
ncbi:hypothetical protein D3C78_1080900 [compost metagenome]